MAVFLRGLKGFKDVFDSIGTRLLGYDVLGRHEFKLGVGGGHGDRGNAYFFQLFDIAGGDGLSFNKVAGTVMDEDTLCQNHAFFEFFDWYAQHVGRPLSQQIFIYSIS